MFFAKPFANHRFFLYALSTANPPGNLAGLQSKTPSSIIHHPSSISLGKLVSPQSKTSALCSLLSIRPKARRHGTPAALGQNPSPSMRQVTLLYHHTF
jgi:hypothetical protein